MFLHTIVVPCFCFFLFFVSIGTGYCVVFSISNILKSFTYVLCMTSQYSITECPPGVTVTNLTASTVSMISSPGKGTQEHYPPDQDVLWLFERQDAAMVIRLEIKEHKVGHTYLHYHK